MILQLILLAVGIFLFHKFGLLDAKARGKPETLAEAYEDAIKQEQEKDKLEHVR